MGVDPYKKGMPLRLAGFSFNNLNNDFFSGVSARWLVKMKKNLGSLKDVSFVSFPLQKT